jgi:hypothetical protein
MAPNASFPLVLALTFALTRCLAVDQPLEHQERRDGADADPEVT